MNKIITALLLVSSLNALVSPTFAGDKNINNFIERNINNSNADIQKSLSDIKRDVQNKNSVGAEMSAIQLQDNLSRRGVMLQLNKSLIKSINENQKQINGNIGR